MQTSLNDQMDNMLDKSKSIGGSSIGGSDYNPQTFDKTIEDFKEIGTGLLTGTIAIPSDIATGAEVATTFLAENAYSPLAMLIKDNLQQFEKEYGRKAFDQGFEEITGIKSDPTNMNQLVGEVLSPTGAFLAPAKLVDKLSDGASALYSKIKNTLSSSDFIKSDLVTEGAYIDPIIATAKKEVDINKPKIDLNVIGENTPLGKERASAYRTAEAKMIKEAGDTPTLQSDIDTMKVPAEKAPEIASLKNYEKLNQGQKDKLFQETGVYRGSDGKLRVKINPSEATLKLENLGFAQDTSGGVLMSNQLNFDKLNNYNVRLRNMLNYEDLYANYGDPIKTSAGTVKFQPIGNILIKKQEIDPDEVYTMGKTLASYDPVEDIIYLSSGDANQIKSSLIHELQHAIQNREGFENGGSILGILRKNGSNYVERRKQSVKVNEKLVNELFEKIDLADEYIKMQANRMSPSEARAWVQEQSDPTSKMIMYSFARQEFDSLINKLADREYQQIKSQGIDKIYLKVDTFHPPDAGFTEMEELFANHLSSNKDFIDFMKIKTSILRPVEKTLDELYNIAQKAYVNKGGEAEARYAQQLIEYENLLPDPQMYYKADDISLGKTSDQGGVSASTSMRNLSPITQEIVFLDNPNTVKNLFLKDTNMAQELGGQIKNQDFRAPRLREGNASNIPDPISIDELNSVRKEIYNLTQMRYKDLPEEITVYRVGKLNQEDGISSFSLDPNYNVETNLPWQKGQDQPLISYKVKKSDILASPDFAEGIGKGRKFDEEEVIIDNDKVKVEE